LRRGSDDHDGGAFQNIVDSSRKIWRGCASRLKNAAELLKIVRRRNLPLHPLTQTQENDVEITTSGTPYALRCEFKEIAENAGCLLGRSASIDKPGTP
jgi:hypothetical protein